MAWSLSSHGGLRAGIRAPSDLGPGSSSRQWRPRCIASRRNLQVCAMVAAENSGGSTTVAGEEGKISSPFEKQEQESSSGLYSPETYEFNMENVDKVLNDVRPYLISDGGNVAVVSIDDGVVSLELQGACGSCPSSTTTMKMGIERVLKEKFGDAVKEVVDINRPTTTLTFETVNAQIDTVRAAIHSYGGTVELASVDAEKGECQVKYKGPVPLGLGIKAAIRDKFPELNTVLVDL